MRCCRSSVCAACQWATSRRRSGRCCGASGRPTTRGGAGSGHGRGGCATFAEKYGAKYEKAVACLTKDRGALPTFHDFPAEHWGALRTPHPAGGVFAAVRLTVPKLVMAAARTWRRLRGGNQLPKVVRGVTLRNGPGVVGTPAQNAA